MFAKSTSGSIARTADSKGSTSVGPKNFTGKLANFSARHRRTVLGAWVVVLVVVAMFFAGSIGDVTADTSNSSSELEYVVAQALVSERISGEAPAKEFVVVEFEKGTAENADNIALISWLEDVVGVTSGPLSSDETTALVMGTLSVTDDEAADIIEPLLTVTSDADASDGFSVATVGQGIGVGFALVILLIVYRAAVAAGLPIMLWRSEATEPPSQRHSIWRQSRVFTN